MGNAPTCIDCRAKVPKTVTFFDSVPFCNGRKVYKFFTGDNWVAIGPDYLCPNCLIRRQNKERHEQRNRETAVERRQQQAAKQQQMREQQRREQKQRERRREQQQQEEWKKQQQREQQRREQQQHEQQRREQQQLEQQRRQQQQLEQRRREQQQREQQRREQQQQEQQRREQQQREQRREQHQQEERGKQQQREKQRREQQQREQQRREQQQLEQQRREQQQLEQQRREQQQLEQRRREQQQKEQQWREQQQLEQQRREQQRREQQQLEQQRREQQQLEQWKREQQQREQQRREQQQQEQHKIEQQMREEQQLEQQEKEQQREQNREQKREQKESERREEKWKTFQFQKENIYQIEHELKITEKQKDKKRGKDNESIKNWLRHRKISDRDKLSSNILQHTQFVHKINPSIDGRSCSYSHRQSLPHSSCCNENVPMYLTEASYCAEISLSDIYVFLCDIPSEKLFDIATNTLIENNQFIISRLLKQCTHPPEYTIALLELVMGLSQSSYINLCVISLALVCVYSEHLDVTEELHTFPILKNYRIRQNNYNDEIHSGTILFRKLCDVLVLLQSEDELIKIRSNINDNLHRFYLTLLDVCFENDYIKSSLNLIHTNKIWEFEDLLYLLWFVHWDSSKGEQVLHLICTFQLQSNEMLSNKMTIKEVLLTRNSKDIVTMLKSLYKREQFRFYQHILGEIEKENNINLELKSEIRNVLHTVYESIREFGYPHKPYERRVNRTLVGEFLSRKNITDISDVELSVCIAEICLGVKTTQDYWPRCTQILSLCMLIKAYKYGCLLEINTGEGKTCIIAMFSVFLAVSKKSVDIISSSPLLAQRDSVQWANFYKQFNVTVASNLTQKESSERLECYRNQVVYGTVGSFASDILRQEFLMENVRGDRPFNVVIVDEVDCLLLEQGMHFTYLSNAAPGMHHLEPILLMIWNEVIRHPVIRSEQNQQYFVGKPEPFHVLLSYVIELPIVEDYAGALQIVYLLVMAGVLPEKFILELKQISVNSSNTNKFRSTLTKAKLFECFQWIESNFDISFEIFEIVNDSTIQIVHSAEPKFAENNFRVLIVGEGLVCRLYKDKDSLCALLQSKIENFINESGQTNNSSEPFYSIPSYLVDFCNNRLPTWINNAFTAKYMTLGREYLITDRDIVPVDFESTGVVELETKWGDGLHQFLELKHEKRLSQMTIVTNFMSNQSFFKRYPQKIFGVSGTLGSSVELSYLKRTFDLNPSKIPPIRRKKHCEIPGVVCGCKKEWLVNIQTTVEKQLSETCYRNKRAVLIICEDINTADEIKTYLQSSNWKSLSLYTRNDKDDHIVEKMLRGGDVIVATNIAGRGTDLEIDDSVIEAGGLFVLVTFLPRNMRVEKQVFGRSARKGQPGSSQIILNKEDMQPYLQLYTDIDVIKDIRDEIEEKRMVEIEEKLLSETIKKEDLFKIYCRYIKNATEFSSLKDIEKNIMLSSMHEFWGLWLKMNCEHLDKLDFAIVKRDLKCALDNARRQVLQKRSPCANLYHIMKFADDKRMNNEFEIAEQLYTKAIESDREWAAFAHYNRAYCVVLQKKAGYTDKAIADFSAAEKGFCKFKEEVMLSLSLIGILTRDTEVTSDLESQFHTRCQILNFFEENVKSSLSTLRELKNHGKKVEANGNNVFTYALGSDKLCKKIESEMYMFWELGMTDIVNIEERSPFSWKGVLVAILGVLQIAVGTVIIAGTSGILTNIGWGLVTEGINDICTGAYAIYNRDNNFIKSWMAGKAINIAISVASFGFNKLTVISKGSKGIKNNFNAVKAELKRGSAKVLAELKGMPRKLVSQSLNGAFRETIKVVAIHTGRELVKRGGKYLLEETKMKIHRHFEQRLRNRVKEQFEKAMNTQKFKDNVERFVYVLIEENASKTTIIDTYRKMTENILSLQNIQQFRQILAGCVVCLVKGTGNAMMKENNKLFQECKPLLDMITTCQSESYDVEKLITVYCQHVNNAITDIYHSKFKELTLEETKCQSQVIAEVKNMLKNSATDHLCAMIKDSFNLTSDNLLAIHLQKGVEGMVSEFAKDTTIRKETLQNILSISQQGPRLTDSTNCVLKATNQGLKLLQSRNTSDIIDTALVVAGCGFNTFGDEQTKEATTFTLKAAKQGFKSVQSGNKSKMIDTALDVVESGINTFGDEQTKEATTFTLKAAKQGFKSVQSGNKSKMIDTALDVVESGINTFGDEQTKEATTFTLKAAKQGFKSVQSGNKSKMIATALDVVESGINTVGDEQTKEATTFTLKAAKQGFKSVQSGNK